MTPPKKHIKRYMLVDGNALIHRGYHAIPALSTKAGQPTNAVYGFTLILLKAMKDIKPTHVACTFDLQGPTFRHEQYKDYKATRIKADQELYDQIPKVKEVVRALNIPIFEKAGFEADDCLGTLAANLHKKDPEAEILIVTGDLDTLQLVNHKIRVYTMRKGITDTVIYDAKAVRERYGLNPEQMVDYKALRGDPSDNIPGVKGIGEKTAADLIKTYKSLDGLYEAIKKGAARNKIKPRVLDLLTEQEAQARQSYQLSRIVLDVPLDSNFGPYTFDPIHQKQVFELFKELEFRSLLNKLPLPKNAESNPEAAEEQAENLGFKGESIGSQEYVFVDSEAKLAEAEKILGKAKELAVDTETSGLDPQNSFLVGVGFCAEPGLAYFIPARQLIASKVLRGILANEKVAKVGHNLKFDLEVLNAAGLEFKGLAFDTMIASYLLDAGTRQHNLEVLAFSELGYRMQNIEELIGKGKGQITMDQVEPQKVSWYCCEDVDITMRLKELFVSRLKTEGLGKIFSEIEMPLVEVLAQMEALGIKLDVKVLNRLSGEAEVAIKELESQIYKMAGMEFNLNSPKQLKEVLFERLGLLPIENRKTKTGLSTSADNLEKMMGQHPVIPKILEYRELAKLQSTYLLALPQLVSPKDGRVHTSYNQTVASTGRLSSTEPNLQNIPIRGEGLGSEIRKSFVAAEGYEFLSIDYSQIELRVVAHLARDQKMMAVFKNGEDIHTKTAMEIFGVPADQVTKDMRRDAKTINFGILYGVSSFGLSSRVGGMSRAEAKEFIAKYFAAYPKVEEYIEQIKLQVNEEGFVRNELGRIRRFPEIKDSRWQIRAAAERAAVNFPIQSLAADVIKVAMTNIHRELRGQTDACRMLLQVHDELLFEVRAGEVKTWACKLVPLMENAIKLSVPVAVEAKSGKNWGEMEKLEV